MKKLVLLGAIVAMALAVAAGPAMGQVKQEEKESRITSGPSAPKTAISSKGDNVNLCTNLLQAAQSGNVANEQGVVQYASKADDLDFTGSSLSIGTPDAPADITATCTQTIEQAAAAG